MAINRKELRESVPTPGAQTVRTQRGFIEDQEAPMAIIADVSEGAETRLEIAVDADYVDPALQLTVTAYLDPVSAVIVGERLAASGRAALDALVEGLK